MLFSSPKITQAKRFSEFAPTGLSYLFVHLNVEPVGHLVVLWEHKSESINLMN